MTDLLKKFIAARRAIADAATPGPWFNSEKWGGVYDKQHGKHNRVISQNSGNDTQGVADDHFIADARNCMSILVRIIEMQDAALESLELGHDHGPTEPHCRPMGDNYGWCDYCHTKMSWGEDAAKEARAQVEALLKEKW